ncbi:hypothetical protein OPT61_g20 [Boeremia exigua]|uniref:Uncharacterized protein n=1 Tax=Boeremia exigua TaxID=749465 RepID=A0ACC2IVA7_9PLEO|nr:hypothetical protein OPT61_g20 [Boeremia exigua]
MAHEICLVQEAEEWYWVDVLEECVNVLPDSGSVTPENAAGYEWVDVENTEDQHTCLGFVILTYPGLQR